MLTANRTSQNTDLHYIERGLEQGRSQDVGHAQFVLLGTQRHITFSGN